MIRQCCFHHCNLIDLNISCRNNIINCIRLHGRINTVERIKPFSVFSIGNVVICQEANALDEDRYSDASNIALDEKLVAGETLSSAATQEEVNNDFTYLAFTGSISISLMTVGPPSSSFVSVVSLHRWQ